MTKFCLKDDKNIDFLQEAFKILSEPNRMRILCLLGKKETMCVCEIIEKLDLKQNLVSHHLGMFKRINIVTSERKGTNIYYKINKEVYNKLKKGVGKIFNF